MSDLRTATPMNPEAFSHFLPVPKVAGRKVLVFVLFNNMTLTSKGDNTNWSYTEIDADELRFLGPYITSITCHTNTIGATSSHSWKAVFWWSYDGRNWNPTNPENLFSAITAGSGAAIQTAYTDTTKFGLQMRYGVGVKNSAGTSISVVHPWDWFTEVEQGRPLMALVFAGDREVSDPPIFTLQTGLKRAGKGLPAVTHVERQLVPPDRKDGTYSTTPGGPGPYEWPKYLAIFVEGVDPTDDPERQRLGFSTDLVPYDDSPLEWVRDPNPVHDLDEVALLAEVLDRVKTCFLEKFNKISHKPVASVDQVVDPDRIYVVGIGRAADLALLALRDPSNLFNGAALVIDDAGGTIGGRKVASPAISNVDVSHQAPPALGKKKAVLAICSHETRVGSKIDDAWKQNPENAPASGRDLEDNGIRGPRAHELVRQDYSAIAALTSWKWGMGLQFWTQPSTLAVFLDGSSHRVSQSECTPVSGNPVDGWVRVWFHDHSRRGETWPSGRAFKAISEIWSFFDTYGP